MSRRARRQQAELEELSAAAPAATEFSGLQAGDSSGNDDEVEQAPAVESAFAALSNNSAVEQLESDDGEEPTAASSTTPSRNKKKKKKPKKPVVQDPPIDGGDLQDSDAKQPVAGSSSTGSTSTSKKSKSKSKSAKTSQSQAVSSDDGLDEIDRALRELGQDPSTTSSTPSTSTSAPAVTARIRTLLGVDPKNLDADAELRKFFGAKVVQSAAATQQQPRGARANNPHHALNRQFRQGGMLAKPQPNWPPAAFAKSGLEMTLVESGNGESIWTFEHSRAYKEVTQMYLEAVASMDPNQLMAILHVHPYHTETLMGLSDMAGQQGDPGMSQDFLDRALYAYERAFAPNFNIQNGNVRLDFRRIESRGFFRGIEKRTSSLMRRGTWRTLFEHTKLLYSLSPFDDPYGALLFLDFTAPKAKQYSWFIDFIAELPRTLSQTGHAQHLQMDSYPGLWYAKALCQWHLEEASKQSHEESTKSLRQAILRYPLTLVILVGKLDRNAPADIAKLDNAQPESGHTKKASYILQLLSQLYVHRSETLWREPEVLEWLLDVSRSTASLFAKDANHADVIFGRKIWQNNLYGANNAVPEGIYRHILVSDIQPIRLFLPKSVLNSMTNVYDPLPPGPGFDDDYFRAMYEGGRRPASTQRGGQASQQGLMQRLMQALQAGGAGGEGGDMDADTQAAILAQFEQMAAARGGGGMPGNFGEGGDLEEGEGSEEGEAEAEAQVQAQAGGFLDFIRGMMGSRQSANAAAQTDETESEDEN